MAPLYSTLTLIAELFVSAAVFYSVYSGYKRNRFPAKLAGAALLYEILFNISYMVSRLSVHVNAQEPPFGLALAIVHGSLSLVMFISLILFFILAWANYRKGVNYFREHKYITFVFLFFWTLSVLSGMLFYFVEYFTRF